MQIAGEKFVIEWSPYWHKIGTIMDRRTRNLICENKEHHFSILRSSKTKIRNFDIGLNIVTIAARIM